MQDGTKRYVSVAVCPTGIDPAIYEKFCSLPEVVTAASELKEKFKGMKLIFGRYVWFAVVGDYSLIFVSGSSVTSVIN